MARLSLTRLVAATALLLPASVLAQRPDEEPYFMGWYLAPDSTEAINCATDEVHTTMTGNRPYAACCKPGDDCRIATDCFGTTVFYNDNSTMECTSGNYCMSFTILQSFPNGGPSAFQLWCNTYWRANTVYKELATSNAATGAVRTVTVTTTATPEATVTFTSPVETATPGASNNGNGDGDSAGASNKAWVAGAVIGPVAALGLVGLAFWYGRRRALDSREAAAAAAAGAAGGAGGPHPRQSVNTAHTGGGFPPMPAPPMSSTSTSPSYTAFQPGQPQPPPPGAVPSYYFQGNPGANQNPPMSAVQQNMYGGYWQKDAASPYSQSMHSTPMSADAVPNSAYPPTTPGTSTGYYTQPMPEGVQSHYTGQRSELGDR